MQPALYMFTLAFLSDPHIAPLPKPSVRELMGKRIFGYLNWKASRKNIHDRAILDAITDDLRRQDADHIAVGGDLINLALPEEFVHAFDWLKTLGPPERVSVIPGNHDAYVDVNHGSGLGLWDAYMAGGAEITQKLAPGPGGFPYVRRFGDVALIGLSSAVPTPPFFASGMLGPEQLAALGRILEALARESLFRIVMVHHPPLTGLSGPRRGLRDVEALERVLRNGGAELVLYGHRHVHAIGELQTNPAATPVVGAPSASSCYAAPGHLARYYLFRIWREKEGWQCEMTGRGLKTASGQITELEKRMLGA